MAANVDAVSFLKTARVATVVALTQRYTNRYEFRPDWYRPTGGAPTPLFLLPSPRTRAYFTETH
jgi:hypothetical protein